MTHLLPPRPTHTSRHGFSLIEAAIVLGIVGLVIGGLWIATASVREAERTDRAISLALQLYENTTRLLHNNVENVYTSLDSVVTRWWPKGTYI